MPNSTQVLDVEDEMAQSAFDKLEKDLADKAAKRDSKYNRF